MNRASSSILPREGKDSHAVESMHGIIMNRGHKWTYRFQVDDNEDSSRVTYGWYVMPCIAVLTSSLAVAILPHGFVPGAGSIRGNAYVIGRVSMSHMD